MRLRKLVTDRWVHVYPGLVSSGMWQRVQLLESLLACRYLEQGHGGQGAPWEQNGLHPMFNIMRIAFGKSQSLSEAFYQPVLRAAALLLVTCGSPVYLVVGFSACVVCVLVFNHTANPNPPFLNPLTKF